MSLALGTRLGPYEILSPLGAGGMGEVYRATDTNLGRQVAIKILPEAFAQDVDRLARFEREARLLATLNHPNIAQIYGVEKADGVRALVMELVEGPTLADRIAQGPIPIDEALPIAKQIAEALEAAHEQSIIHRDLKPANIKLRPDGTVKVLDFGLAKALEPAISAMSPNVTQSPTITSPAMMTNVGVLLGTATYMSPEQARGKMVDKRSDIWAFGCVLHEMLTGQRAFVGEDVSDTLANVLKMQPAWERLPADVPARIRQVLRACLQKNAKQRIGDAQDLRLAFEGAFDTAGVQSAAPVVASWRPVMFVSAAALIVVGLLAALALGLGRRAPDATALTAKITFNVAMPSSSALLHLTVSPDGKYLTGIASADSENLVWLRTLDRLDAQTVDGSEGATFPFWSPDSRVLAFFADGKLKKVDVSGAPPQTLCDAPQGGGGTWNREGVIVFSPTRGPLFRVSASGGDLVQLTELDASRRELAHRHPYFLPDGQHFLFTAVSAEPENTGIYVGSLDSKERKRLVSSALKAAFSPPGYILFVRHDASAAGTPTGGLAGAGGTLMVQQFDPKGFEILGDPFPIAEVGGNFGNGGAGFAVAAVGVLAYRVVDADRAMQWYDGTGKQLGTVETPAPWESPSVSPDLQRLVVLKRDGTASDLWILDEARRTTTRLTLDRAFDDAPVWSPDGARIVFSSNRNGPGDLYITNWNSAGQAEVLLKSDHQKIPDDWSADGRFILYRDIDVKTGPDLWALPMAGDRKPQPVLATPFAERQGRFSPDGRWIAYVSDESGTNQVYVQSFPPSAAKWPISAGGGAQPRWRRDGKALFFMGGAISGGFNTLPLDVMAVDVDTSDRNVFKAGVPRKLFTVVPHSSMSPRNSWDVTPDGQRFLVVSNPTTTAPPVTVVVNWLQGLHTR